MIDWQARIDELADLLARKHSMRDRMGLEILLAALVECPHTAAAWIMLETNWMERTCYDAWFSFGGLWTPASMARLRLRYPYRELQAEIKTMLDFTDAPQLFVEPEYEHFVYLGSVSLIKFVAPLAPRLRVVMPRTDDAIWRVDRRAGNRLAEELKAAATLAVVDRVQARPAAAPRFVPPPNFLYHLETVQRLSPWYTDWNALVRAFTAIAIRHAHLYGRQETGPEDYKAMARLAEDTIPFWVRKGLELIFRESAAQPPKLWTAMRLNEARRWKGHGGEDELTRLQRNDIVRLARNKYIVRPEHKESIRALLEGRAFTALASAA